MKRMLRAVLLLVIAAPAMAADTSDQPLTQPARMDNQRLQALITGIADSVDGRSGYWRFTLHGFSVAVAAGRNRTNTIGTLLSVATRFSLSRSQAKAVVITPAIPVAASS